MTKPIDKLIKEAGVKFPVHFESGIGDNEFTIYDLSGMIVADSLPVLKAESIAHMLNTWHQARKALEPIIAWWTFVQADKELTDGVPFDESVVALSFMGSGASTNVTVGQLNELAKALNAMNNVEGD